MSMIGYTMQFPVIKVKDKYSGKTHIVGTDSHDELYVGKDGQLHYSNLQNGDGSGSEEGYGYIFAGEEDDFNPHEKIQFVSFDELLEIVKKEAGLSAEKERTIREMSERIFEEYFNEIDQSVESGLIHT